jgi:hypothetical protein
MSGATAKVTVVVFRDEKLWKAKEFERTRIVHGIN